MKIKVFYIIIAISFSKIALASFDSPSFMVNQSEKSIKIQQKAGDILAFAINGVAITKAIYEKDWEGLKQYSYATGTTEIATFGLKYSINRQRPNGDPYSFPSGHTSFSFAGATFLQIRYGYTWGIPALALASFVGYSRIASQKHYTSDVLAGAFIGVLTNLYFTKPLEVKINQHSYNIYVSPYVDSTQAKLMFNIAL